MPNNQKERIYTIGIDMAGLQGYFYKIVQYEDAGCSLETCRRWYIFYQVTKMIYMNFFHATQWIKFFFVNHICYLKSSVKKASKIFKRTRATANTTSGTQSRTQSPPRRNLLFPSSIFFTPKRVNTKKDYGLISK